MTGQVIPQFNGYSYNWTLFLSARGMKPCSFYLGQDVKFIERVLGKHTSDVVAAIGTNDLRTKAAQKRLGNYIIRELNLDVPTVKSLSPWALCAE